MGYLVTDRFLWASDYIQTVAEPTAYTSEVWNAAQRDGLRGHAPVSRIRQRRHSAADVLGAS